MNLCESPLPSSVVVASRDRIHGDRGGEGVPVPPQVLELAGVGVVPLSVSRPDAGEATTVLWRHNL